MSVGFKNRRSKEMAQGGSNTVTGKPEVVFLDAYSRGNIGDGLLVDLSIDMISRALGTEIDAVVVASDAASFEDLPRVIQVPGVSGPTLQRVRESIGSMLRIGQYLIVGKMRIPAIDQQTFGPSIIVGVGGGSLRSGHLVESLKTLVTHVSQLFWAAGQESYATVYMPQSIGPLGGVVGRLIRTGLKKLDLVCLRDDTSVAEIGAGTRTIRVPDLAVLEISRRFGEICRHTDLDRTYLIARDLHLSPDKRGSYLEGLNQFYRGAPELEVLVQSSVRGNNDVSFYESIGWGSRYHQSIDTFQRKPGVVVSVRLHGALQALLSGCPAIHLSYERKGPSAFRDLGLESYTHPAQSFSPSVILNQIDEIRRHPAEYWEQVSKARVHIDDAERHLVAAIRDLLPQRVFAKSRDN